MVPAMSERNLYAELGARRVRVGGAGRPGRGQLDRLHGHVRVPTVTGTVTVEPMFALSSVARTLIVRRTGVAGVQRVGPVAAPGRRMPGAAAVGGDLDPADHPPPVSVAVPLTFTAHAGRHGRAGGRRGDPRRRAASCRSTVAATVSPVCRVAGCAPMSASRLTVACCIGRAGRRRCRGRGCRRAPRTTGRCRRRRPARRWAPGTASGGGWRCRRRTCRAVVRAGTCTRRRVGGGQVDQAGRAEAVVGVLVPLVAERPAARASRWRRRPGVATVVFRQNRILPSAAGTWMASVRARVDREDRAGQRVLRPAAVAGRAEARVAPGAGPGRRVGRVDHGVGVRLLVGDQRPVRPCSSRRCWSRSGSSRTTRCR